jgi:hypothetical protein
MGGWIFDADGNWVDRCGWWILLGMMCCGLGAVEVNAAVGESVPPVSAPAVGADAAAKENGAEPTATSGVEKWLAEFDAQARAEYERTVAKLYEKGVAEAQKQYLAALDGGIAQAEGTAAQLEAAHRRTGLEGWREERDRIAVAPTDVPADGVKESAGLKGLRHGYRTQLSRIAKDREQRARALLAHCDELLVKRLAVSRIENRAEEVALLQKERDQLRIDWMAAPEAGNGRGGEGHAAAKMKLPQLVAKLRELNAQVWIKSKGVAEQEIVADSQEVDPAATVVRVLFRAQRADQTPLTAADYEILDALSEVQELQLSGPAVRDAEMEKLRGFRALRSLSLDRVRPGPAGYAVLSTLPVLRTLSMNDTGAKAEEMAEIFKCRKLQSLTLAALKLTDEALADIGKLTELESLQFSELGDLTSKGFEHLPECRALRRFGASGFIVLSGMVEHLGHCKTLRSVSLPNSYLKDAEVAPLSDLPKLQDLELSNAPLTGIGFAQWRVHKELGALNLENGGGANDEACWAIAKAFPKLESLSLKTAETGFTAVGAAALGHLRTLHALRLTGPGVNDGIVEDLAHATELSSLSIPSAELTEAGAAVIGRLFKLQELSLDVPPITPAALKSFAHCRKLRSVNIGKDASPETETLLKSVLPEVEVHRSE